jgi:hypothetical protein
MTIPSLPQLSFVPVESLVIHEQHDDQRTLPLIHRIRNSGVWRNPPVVALLQDESGRYMVLDGANRTTALHKMGFPHALVQIVDPQDPGLSLQTWNHVVWEMKPARFVRCLEEIPDIGLEPVEEEGEEPDLFGGCGLVFIQLHDERTYSICTSLEVLVDRVRVLNQIVDTYRLTSRLDRTSVRTVKPLIDIYPNLCGLVMFPRFSVQEVLRLAGEGYLLPTGITRFTISPRALHLNYPLSELSNDRPLEDKNDALQRWIQDRLNHKGIRYYAEATFLFDE